MASVMAPKTLPAQTTGNAVVRGVVVTDQDQPVALAIVELRVRTDSTPVRTTRTSEAGRFELDSVAAGVYHVIIRGIGFAPGRTPEFTVVAGQIRDLGRIGMQMVAVQLDPIEVTVERPDVVIGADRTGYLVEALANASGGMVTDVLREIPDLMVDIDGTVRLRGNTPAIFINGKPAPMNGVSLTVFLEQFPADRIERIEVLDHPPARYSAEGSAGVINIVLRQGVELGLTGSVALAAGTRNTYTGSGRATLQRGKLVANAGINARWNDSKSADFTLRENLLASPITFLQQDARSNRSNQNGGLSFDFRYNLSPRSRLSGYFFGNLNWNDRDGSTATSHLDEARVPTLYYDRLARQNSTGGNAETRVAFARIWQEDRHELEIELSAQRNSNRNQTREEIAADSVFHHDELLPPWLTQREDGSRNTGATLEASYQRPWESQGRLELGASVRTNQQTDDQLTRLFEEVGNPLPDELDDRVTRRNQDIASGYLTVNRRMGKFALNLGLRGEWVTDRIQLPEGTLLDRGEANLFPNVSINWGPRPRMQVRLGYSQRVNRPGVSVLDPTNRSTDPLNRSVGNPDIKSSLTRNLTLGFNWGGRRGQLNVGPYWNRTTDGWERVTTVDSNGVSTSIYQNLTARTTLGAGVNYSLPPIRGWNARMNLSLSRTTLQGSLVSQGLEEGKLRWSVGSNFSGPVVQGLQAQGTFGYEPGRDLVQGRTTGQWRADFSFRYRLMRNRTTIGISLQDPFELRKTSQVIRDPSVIQTGSSRVTTRSMTINVSYAFGGGKDRPGEPVRR
jgi:outer membrane receptor protein involved in Fe transport